MTEDYSESIASTLLIKLPFFILGVAIGMFTVWVAFQWVPEAVSEAQQVPPRGRG